MSTLTATEVDQIMGDLKIVDGDSHFAEPADLWTSRAPASMKDKMPQIKKIHGGSSVSDYGWFIGDDYWTGLGGHTIAHGNQKTHGVLCLPYEDIGDAAWTVKDRLALMDEQGVYAAVLYPNAMGFASNMMLAIPDVEFRLMVQRLYNDALVDYQVEPDDPERDVPNPAWATVDDKVRQARSEIADLQRVEIDLWKADQACQESTGLRDLRRQREEQMVDALREEFPQFVENQA